MSFICVSKELNPSLQGQRSTFLYQSTKAAFHKLSMLIYSTCTQLSVGSHLTCTQPHSPSLVGVPAAVAAAAAAADEGVLGDCSFLLVPLPGLFGVFCSYRNTE